MRKVPSHLKLVPNVDIAPGSEIAVIASITQIEVVVPWYLRVFSAFIPNPYMLTLQDFTEEQISPLQVQNWTMQCSSFEELRDFLRFVQQSVSHRGKLFVVDYTHQLGALTSEFNQ